MPVGPIVIRSVAVVSIRMVTAMTIVVAIGMMGVNPHVFTVINIDVDVIVATLDIGLVARVFN